ncbi:hypothetical protein HYU91_02485 [Candidatus Collierbacteria bacterium]|nr:hypothetical protein [Candidatus Collierbacteria bacterium]
MCIHKIEDQLGIITTAGVWKDRQDIKKITRQHSRYALIVATAIKHKLTLKTVVN